MQFKDLEAQYRRLKPEIDAAIQSVLESSHFIMGKPVFELEEQLAEYVGRKHCISCASGTDALQLSLMALNVGVGDAVFVPDFTYFASAGAVSMLGASVIPVDIDKTTFNISPEALNIEIKRVIDERKLTPKVIMPVNLFGLPADYAQISRIAYKYGMKILEDSAQGFGGSIGCQKACSFGNISVTSFFPAKPLGCYGDGGAIFVDDDELKSRLISLRAHGRSADDKYDNIEIGTNSRLDTIQAAILLPKFKAFKEYELDAVNYIADVYTDRLSRVKNITVPYVPDGYRSCQSQYTVRFKDESTRNRVRKALNEKEIPTNIFYPRGIHQQKAYEKMNWNSSLYPNTVKATETVLSLPIHPYLSEADVDRISEIIAESV